MVKSIWVGRGLRPDALGSTPAPRRSGPRVGPARASSASRSGRAGSRGDAARAIRSQRTRCGHSTPRNVTRRRTGYVVNDADRVETASPASSAQQTRQSPARRATWLNPSRRAPANHRRVRFRPCDRVLTNASRRNARNRTKKTAPARPAVLLPRGPLRRRAARGRGPGQGGDHDYHPSPIEPVSRRTSMWPKFPKIPGTGSGSSGGGGTATGSRRCCPPTQDELDRPEPGLGRESSAAFTVAVPPPARRCRVEVRHRDQPEPRRESSAAGHEALRVSAWLPPSASPDRRIPVKSRIGTRISRTSSSGAPPPSTRRRRSSRATTAWRASHRQHEHAGEGQLDKLVVRDRATEARVLGSECERPPPRTAAGPAPARGRR